MTVTSTNVGAAISAAIPELKANVEDNEELHHLTFFDLFSWAKHSAEFGSFSDLRRAIHLVDSILGDCDAYIRNAVTVSFLEHIDPDDQIGRRMFEDLTPALRQQWLALDAYMQQLNGRPLRGSVSRAAGSEKS